MLSRCDAINRCAERIIHYTAIGSTDQFSRAELRGFLEIALSEFARDSPASPGSGEGSYYTWVDQFNTLGVGENVRINTGNQSEGLLVLRDEKWVVLRVPYPMVFCTKWVDGRIDDPHAGWKGRGLWASISTRTPFHMEGGKGTTSKAIKFQLRPDPLAG